MAECHPVGFQWVMEAKARGATIIHVDPRFTRTSAVADLHVPIRAGSDIAFLGGLVNYVLSGGHEFHDYLVAYTNAPVILREDFQDTEDLDGLFSGFDPEHRHYDGTTWQYEGTEVASAAGQRDTQYAQRGSARGEAHGSGGATFGGEPERDESLQHPRCVYQVLKRHFARYTPEMVERVCGIPPDLFYRVAEALVANSGRERTSAFAYAVGWTQHTVGVQYIRTAAILQTLLGNIGRPGGGILALRGHASIQGSTDIPTLFNLLPGYIPMPHAHEHETLDDFVAADAGVRGFWGNMKSYTVSLLKAWWGDAATADNDYCFDYLPRLTGDHSSYLTVMDKSTGGGDGYFLVGENPAVGSANAKMQRLGMANIDWLVVRDFSLIESATWWKDGPEIETGELRTEDIGTEVFFLPAAAHTEKDGSFTNTQRLLQWHHKAVEPGGDARSDLWFYYHLGRIIRQKLADSTDPRDRPLLDLTWNYPTEGRTLIRAPRPCWPRSTDSTRTACHCPATPPSRTTEVLGAAAGSTRASTPTASTRPRGASRAASRAGSRRSGRGPGRPTGASSTTAPPPTQTAGPGASARPTSGGTPSSRSGPGTTCPDFEADKRPDYRPAEDAQAEAALSGIDPFIMQADGKAWLYVPTGLTDGPLPTHYEPHESPFDNALYGQRSNPVREQSRRKDNPYHPPGNDVFPYVFTTYRLTEHHTAGGMSRWQPYLSELQPEMFCEISPELARERGLEHLGWATVVTARTAIEARVIVTDRMVPLTVQGRVVHQIGLPYHWGPNGVVRGDAANELLAVALDPNVHIQESKAATCDIQPGRRPRGPELLAFLEGYRRRAGITDNST